MSDITNSEELEQLVQRIEAGEANKKAEADFVKDIYLEAKSRGYDTKALKKVIKMRAMDKATLEQEEAVVDTYRAALGV